jgi:hypothetical protein
MPRLAIRSSFTEAKLTPIRIMLSGGHTVKEYHIDAAVRHAGHCPYHFRAI